MKRLTAVFLLIAGLAACHASKNSTTTKTTPPPSDKTVVEVNPELVSAQAKVPGITMQELTDGKKLFVERCSNCHELKNPGDYTAQQWEPIVAKMTRKAHISDEGQKLLIRNYVVAYSK
jgi:cytochrome c5